MQQNKTLSVAMIVFHIVIVILFATCTEYQYTGTSVPYAMFQDVHIMIFVGFGFLMAFLHKNCLTTIGHSFLLASFVALWAMLNHGFWSKVMEEHRHWERIRLSLDSLVLSDFAAGAVLISFGAVVGRISAFQLMIMAFFEVIFYSINEAILVEKYHVADIGGSMIIHSFGAYFGLACSFLWDKMNPEHVEKGTSENKSTHTSDTFAMIGTLFLWCFWPSFNACLSGGNAERTVINTYLSIVSSCVFSFYLMCLLYDGKFRMVEAQNATLAGGVAIGATADMLVNPYGAILVGSVSGAISVVGYKWVSEALEKAGLRDTCGVHNLHGMPGLVGAITSCIVVATIQEKDYDGRNVALGSIFAHRGAAAVPNGNFPNSEQALNQFYGMLTTLGMALGGGAFTGVILGTLKHWDLLHLFQDGCEWEMEAETEEEAKEAEMLSSPQSTKAPSEPSFEASSQPAATSTPDKHTWYNKSIAEHGVKQRRCSMAKV